MVRGHTEGLNIVLGSLHPGVHPPRSRGEGLDMGGLTVSQREFNTGPWPSRGRATAVAVAVSGGFRVILRFSMIPQSDFSMIFR